jgi:hypothetical protein
MAVRPKSLEDADRLLARSAFLIVLAVHALFFGGAPGDSDRRGELVHQATRAMALGDGLLLRGDTPESAALIAEGFEVRPVEGGAIANVEPLVAAMGVPFHWVGAQLGQLLERTETVHAATSPGFAGGRSEYWAHLFVGLQGPLYGAATVTLVCVAALRLGARRRTALTGSLVLAFATCLWPSVSVVGGAAPAAMLAAGALVALLVVRDRFYRLTAPSVPHWLLLGTLLAALAACEPLALPAVLVLAYSAVRMSVRGRQRLWSMPLLRGGAGRKRSVADMTWFLLPMAAIAALWWWGHVLRVGPLPFAPLDGLRPLDEWPRELLGLFVSPGKGLVWLAPVVFFALFGALRFAQEPRLLGFTIVAPLAVLLASAATGEWSSLDEFAPRGASVALALAWPAVVVGYDQVRARLGWRAVGVALAVLGLVVNTGGVVVSRGTWRTIVEQAAPQLLPEGPAPSDPAFARAVAFDWHSAAPWFAWRVVRHRAAAEQGGFSGDVFPARQVFAFTGVGSFTVGAPRDRGFSHLCWVDYEERLDGRMWPVVLLVAAAFATGVVGAVAALDPTRP